MSTPPAPPPSKPIRLAPIAAALVAIIIVAFGICAKNFELEGPSNFAVNASVVVELACIVGLIVLAIIAISRRNNPH